MGLQTGGKHLFRATNISIWHKTTQKTKKMQRRLLNFIVMQISGKYKMQRKCHCIRFRMTTPPFQIIFFKVCKYDRPIISTGQKAVEAMLLHSCPNCSF